MDTTKAITHVSLCAGYGGIDLGIKRVLPNLLTVAFSEIEAFACANLVAKMEAGLLDAAPIWTDVKTFPWDSFRGKVDILSGGYPCQPFSSAGKRLGSDDPRHLWPSIADGIRRMRPRLCFFENVEGHITLGLLNVLQDLAGMGYRTTWGIFSASEVGAPHQRKRVFIMAHCRNEGFSRHGGLEQVRLSEGWKVAKRYVAESGQSCWPSGLDEPQYEWEPPRTVQPQSSLGGDADGPAGGLDYAKLCVSCDNRTDELRLLGNGVVPATAALAFTTLYQQLTS